MGTALSMTRPLPRLTAALAPVLALGLAACGGGADEEAVPTTTTKVERTTTTAEPASTTSTTVDVGVAVGPVPQRIDEAYVEAVMARLDETLQAAFADAAVNGTAGNEFQANIRAIYGPDQVMRTITDLDGVGPAAIANPPGRPTTTVVELRTASPSCIFFVAERDLSPLAAEDYEQDLPTYVQLVPADPAPGNPTPWLIEFDFTYDDGTDPGDPCA